MGQHGRVSGVGAGAFVELPIGDEAGLVADEGLIHVGLNVTLSAGDVPNTEIVQGTAEAGSGRTCNLEPKAALREGDHSRLLCFEHAVAVDAHEVAALAGHQGKMLPGADQARGWSVV